MSDRMSDSRSKAKLPTEDDRKLAAGLYDMLNKSVMSWAEQQLKNRESAESIQQAVVINGMMMAVDPLAAASGGLNAIDKKFLRDVLDGLIRRHELKGVMSDK